jgi:polysaccharide chain length determinant protein (PEP-CTERM system associated)
MNQTTDMINPMQFVEIVKRRRWYLMLFFCLSLIVGIVLAVVLPKIYLASTMILVQPQKVPDNYVRSIVSSDINSRINTISQQILSRSNIERIIKEFNLFPDIKQRDMYMEDKVRIVRKGMSVDLIRANRGGSADAFSISFKGADPKIVMRVTNSLASYFIDENLRVREEQASGTSDFIDDELSDTRLKLEKQEEALKEYRATYMGGLPEQLQTNLRIFEGLQLQLNIKNESLRFDKNNLLLLEKQIEETAIVYGATSENTPAVIQGVRSENQIKLEQLESNLSDLESNYTARHPDIIRLKKQIEDLTTKIDAETVGTPEKPATQVPRRSGQVPPIDERSRQMLEREDLKIRISNLEADIKKIEGRMLHYQRMVEDTPNREQELISLNRDYQNIKASYNSLLTRKLESDIAVNMEKKQKGEQFRILDRAKIPEKPSEPDMKKLFLMVLAAGLGIGAGWIFLLEYMDNSFRKPEEVETELDIPVLCTIPQLYQAREIKMGRLNHVLFAFSALASLCLFLGFAALTFKGVDKTLAFVRQFINI